MRSSPVSYLLLLLVPDILDGSAMAAAGCWSLHPLSSLIELSASKGKGEGLKREKERQGT